MAHRIRTAALMLTAAACLLVAVAFTGRAEEEVEEAPAETPEPAKKLAGANNEFGVELFRKLHESGSNTFISPTSIAACLQMARQGAGGETRTQMDDAMKLDGIDVPGANKSLMGDLDGREDVTLNVANSVWADPSRLNVNKEYADELIESFDGEARVADFSDPETLGAINGWISDKTEKMIPKMLDEITEGDLMFLINAIYFKGGWTDEFDKDDTAESDWHNADGTTGRIDLMSRTDRIHYVERDGHQIVKLPYGDDEDASMLVVLPEDTAGLDKLVKSLSAGKLSDWADATRKSKGTLKLPRFEMKYKEKLNKQLKELGIEDAFNSAEADFHRMGESPLGPLFIGFVLHEARVIVNEEGTEAAAASMVGVRAGSVSLDPFEMVCDRPFLFAIMDEPTGSILFMGTVYKPEKPE